MTGIDEVVGKADGIANLATEQDVSYEAVRLWVKQGFVPKDRARAISDKYGVEISRLLNPKLLELLG